MDERNSCRAGLRACLERSERKARTKARLSAISAQEHFTGDPARPAAWGEEESAHGSAFAASGKCLKVMPHSDDGPPEA